MQNMKIVGLDKLIDEAGIKQSFIARELGTTTGTVNDWVRCKTFPKKARHMEWLLERFKKLTIEDIDGIRFTITLAKR